MQPGSAKSWRRTSGATSRRARRKACENSGQKMPSLGAQRYIVLDTSASSVWCSLSLAFESATLDLYASGGRHLSRLGHQSKSLGLLTLHSPLEQGVISTKSSLRGIFWCRRIGRAEKRDRHNLPMSSDPAMLGGIGSAIRQFDCVRHCRSTCNTRVKQQLSFLLPCVIVSEMKTACICITLASAASHPQLARLIGDGRQIFIIPRSAKLWQVSATVSLLSIPLVKNNGLD